MLSTRLNQRLRLLTIAVALMGPVLLVSACSSGTAQPGSAPTATRTGATGNAGQHK
ncbi:hypothetical protein J8J14_17805 [Roseomonas sp. SSH11]|uniref:Uncharacterized protein n=1 Tax=Pararoseomonas baculiformis TaxID=2820812 RepID=A0ABS4AJE5_9PROT|nr:hypothetical protein [Pararoseomonas baculiformis]MBP0446633.1 hypothetical protein [Pararoseomonas baculiformis]